MFLLKFKLIKLLIFLNSNKKNMENKKYMVIEKIIFIGNNSFSTSKLKSIMKTKERRFLRFFSSADRYDPDKIEYDKQLISQFYNNNGYYINFFYKL